MTELATTLVQNLKELNAKERDHLMRFAYLGATEAYEGDTKRWLSDEMLSALKPQLADIHLSPSARCVFAAMDYHLDWLYAALFRTYKGGETGVLDDGSPCKDDSLRPIIGILEDLDLLVVFADDEKVVVLCIEAKGDASFSKLQLARKLVRLDRIITASVGSPPPMGLHFKLVLIAPNEPAFNDCVEHAKALPGERFSDMRGYLANHPSGIGTGLRFLKLAGFPKTLKKVTRVDPTNASPKRFTHWKIEKR